MDSELIADQANDLRAVDLPTVSEIREASSEDVARAVAILRPRLDRLKELDGVIHLDFGSDKSIYVDCRSGSLVEARPSAGRLVAHPDDLVRVMESQLDPRSAMLFSILKVGGDVPTVTQFCDRLAGVRSQTYMDGSPEFPKLTGDWAKGREDLKKFGYCLIKDVLSPDQLATVRQRLVDQAAAEEEAGVAWWEGKAGHARGPTQRVWNLANKGQPFLDMLKLPIVDYFMRPALGDYYTVSNYLSVIAGPGNEPQQLHYDQTGVQPAVGQFPVGMNILWFLDDVTEANGGTRVFPGSHEVHVGPDNIFVSDGTVAAEGPAGSAMIFDTRLWHGTGANRTDKLRHVAITLFYRAWMRPQVNPWTSIHPDVAASFDDQLKVMFGYRCTSTHGGREDQIEGELNGYDPSTLVTEMKPRGG
ncbi:MULTISPECIES: phytanoyl-CoA dioxygenase family protein [Sphingobium]|uniref:phytanoyl-CoA dioxygenase family protein n=1 Tax=Sphingobium sp. MI1205 TaxID=407020 RepID=UPI000770690B|nr:phytanoyl-CoA dioxygenase family protein [Sphingobium sp. MI1205]AMK19577.1 protein involved in biosynthesis of mitomycin antibiotics/polyketide fumonisin [Sphingobium sp. MI1205]